jgi:serine/threonine protein kinase
MTDYVKKVSKYNWETFNEISVLQLLDHPGVVKLLGVTQDTDHYYLTEPRHSPTVPRGEDLVGAAFHLLTTLAYFELNHVIHGDLRPSNVVWAGTNPGTGGYH